MRSPLTFLFGSETSPRRGDLSKGRPEALRRAVLATNSRIVLIASILGLPAAFYMLVGGALMPFVLAVVGLCTGFMTLELHRRGQFERAAFGQVYGTLIVGLVLTLADPQIVDFGLAVALLAPVQASLLSRTPAKKRAWVLLLAVVAIGCLGAVG